MVKIMAYYFIKNGQCKYSIVVSKSSEKVQFASQELIRIVKASCQCTINVFHDDTTPSTPCIFLGEVKQTKMLPDLDCASLSFDGFSIQVVGENVFIRANGDGGIIYGVYAFLRKQLGYEFWGYNAEKINKISNVKLISRGFSLTPDIQTRVRSLSYGKYDQKTEYAYGFNISNGRHWITWAHTHFSLMPKSKYWTQHRDYYSEDGNQLCLTNREMVEEMKKNVLAKLTVDQFNQDDLLYLMIGHEDNNSFCSCPHCKQAMEEHGGKSGVMMRFINEIADTVNAFVEKNYPNKVIKTITFAYGPTIDAPCKKTSENKYIPFDDSVVAHKNVGVMLAPLGSDWAHSLTDENYNKKTAQSLLGWKAIGPDLFVWTYDSVFDDSFVFIDNWKWLKESYKAFRDFGAVYIFDQGHCDRGFNFESLRNYVRAKLMWNLNENVDALIHRFFKEYYGCAGGVIKKYFYALRKHFMKLEKRYTIEGKRYKQLSYVRTWPDYKHEEWWDKAMLEKYISKIKKCLSKMSNDGNYGVRNRVEIELLSPIYVLTDIFGYQLDRQTILENIDFFRTVCERNDIYSRAEHGLTQALTVEKKLIEWRALTINK